MQVASFSDGPVEHVRVKPSWIAYLGPAFWALLVFVAGEGAVWLASGLRDPGGGVIWSFLAGMAVLVGVGGWFWYQLALIGSRVLYTDETGVRYAQGILPWAKALIWVKWRDMDTATCTLGFGSWMFNAYRVRIGHRFTLDTEIIMFSVPKGPTVVGQINALHQRYINQQGEAASLEARR